MKKTKKYKYRVYSNMENTSFQVVQIFEGSNERYPVGRAYKDSLTASNRAIKLDYKAYEKGLLLGVS